MTSPAALAPSRLGRYELIARLASGGMGEIFLARLEGAAGFEKLYVLKRILPHLADDVRFRAMLVSEARIASMMAHANICQVYELGETDGQLYIVMEHLEGVALLTLLRRASLDGTPLALGFVGGVVQQVADALHYAHELVDRGGESLGIVHRDVTPGNIFLTETGMAKVLDFGIAKVKNASAHTQTGTVKGKYAYMAPEQLRGAGIDRRVDVFALGVVVYEMLALRRLFQRKTDYLTFRAVMEQPVPDIRRFRPDLPDALADVITRAIDRDADRRPATARQLGAAVIDALGTRPWSTHDIGELVRSSFASELAMRRAQTISVIDRTVVGRGAAVPPLAPADFAPVELEDDGFPWVETSDSDAEPQDAPPGAWSAPGFGFDPHAPTAPALAPPPLLAAAPGPSVPARPARRGARWVVLAIAVVATAVVASVIAVRQLRPPDIVVTREPAPRDVPPARGAVEPASPAAVEPASPAAAAPTEALEAPVAPAPAGAPPAPPPNRAPTRPPRTPGDRTVDAYTAAITAHRARMNACAKQHGLPTRNTFVVIEVTLTGRPRSVSLEPAGLDHSPMGFCIREALSSARFPRSHEEKTIRVPISIKPT